MAAGAASREIVWILRLLASLESTLGIRAPTSMDLHIDNQGALDITKDPKDHQRTKHIDVQHHFIRDLVRKGTIVPKYVSSKQNVADILTTALPGEAHEEGMRKLVFECHEPQQRGEVLA
jgi:ATP sulfurylase